MEGKAHNEINYTINNMFILGSVFVVSLENMAWSSDSYHNRFNIVIWTCSNGLGVICLIRKGCTCPSIKTDLWGNINGHMDLDGHSYIL